MQSIHEVLKLRTPQIWGTQLLIATNLLVFLAMLADGAGFWHSPNGIQLAWGANFGPATQDGQWWRLGSAIFLHFGVIHLALNMWSLWDAGQLVERMYGHFRFICIYFISGLFGNLASLVIQGNIAVSGGASGAIFGIYGALLVFLWLARSEVTSHEFRWLFWGALAFASITIVLGFIIPGIDNSAHIGGFISGILASLVFSKSTYIKRISVQISWLSIGILIFTTSILIFNLPAPKYRWSDEILIRKEIDAFLYRDQEINRSWLEVIYEGKQGEKTFDALANQIDTGISNRYEESFEKLSQLPANAALPSAAKLAKILQYVQHRKDESKAVAEKLRQQDHQ